MATMLVFVTCVTQASVTSDRGMNQVLLPASTAFIRKHFNKEMSP